MLRWVAHLGQSQLTEPYKVLHEQWATTRERFPAIVFLLLILFRLGYDHLPPTTESLVVDLIFMWCRMFSITRANRSLGSSRPERWSICQLSTRPSSPQVSNFKEWRKNEGDNFVTVRCNVSFFFQGRKSSRNYFDESPLTIKKKSVFPLALQYGARRSDWDAVKLPIVLMWFLSYLILDDSPYTSR